MAVGRLPRSGEVASCTSCQHIPGNLRQIHVDDRKVKTCCFNSPQGKASRLFAPHPGGKLDLKEVG